jgi:hypothetical protein
MIRTTLLAVGLLLAMVGAAWSGGAVAGVPEETGVVQRYDSVHNVIYIDGRGYRVTGEAMQTLAQFVAEHGAAALNGRQIAFAGGRDEHDRLYIDTIAY